MPRFRVPRLHLLAYSSVIAAVGAAAAQKLPASTAAQSDRRRSPVVEVFEQARDAVVNISTTRVVRMQPSLIDIFEFGPRARSRQVHSVGSGVVVHPGGYLVTNAHVVAQASDIGVTFADGHTAEAEIIAVDSEHDLAVLKIQTDRPLHAQKLGRSDDLLIGETVVAIGNPLGLQHTVTAGIVSAVARDLEFSGEVQYKGLIQTDASINPGNSGGPLLNVNGELIGINTAIRGDAQNIGFAIPVDRLWELLPAMLDIERHERVAFGLDVSGPDASVRAVQPDSPAAQAGVRVNDTLISFDGEPIRDGIDYYVHLLARQPGDEIRLGLRRAKQELTVEIPLQAKPLPDGNRLAGALLGITLGPIPARIRRAYGLPAHIGLMVEEVQPGSPAGRAEMRPGDLILRIDRVTTASLEQIGLALERVTPGESVTVEGLRVDADGAFTWTVAIRTRSGV